MNMIHIARISHNADFGLPQKTRQPRDACITASKSNSVKKVVTFFYVGTCLIQVLCTCQHFQVSSSQESRMRLFSFHSLTHSVFESFFKENYKNVFKITSYFRQSKYLSICQTHFKHFTCAPAAARFAVGSQITYRRRDLDLLSMVTILTAFY